MEVKILIPTKGRAQKVQTKNILETKNYCLCCSKSEKEEYRKYNPDVEIVTHADTLKGLSMKRDWIYKHFGNVFMIDDDVNSVYRFWITNKNELSPRLMKHEVYDIIQRTAQMAHDLGCYLFGFNQGVRPSDFAAGKPFRLTGLCNGCAIGMLKGSRLSFVDDIIANEDFFISCLNAYHHRYLFVDNRFKFQQKNTFKLEGGLSAYRNLDAEQKDFATLKQYFGDVVQKKRNIGRKHSHKYEKRMVLPF
jgi:hypothetical protein